MDRPHPLTAGQLDEAGTVRHGFFTRTGGISTGRYASLNCGLGSRDDPGNVRENRGRAMSCFGLGEGALLTAYQVHSADVAKVVGPWAHDQRPQVDGLVTRTPGLALGILTADCTPVLFADHDAGVIGAAHAGWRGALAGIVEATTAAMVDLGARREKIVAAVGPCIQHASYEVGAEFRVAVTAEDPANADLFAASDRVDHYLFDLPAYVARRLSRAGVAAIEMLPVDTCAEAELFFSYRRTTHDGGGDYGRQLSAIALLP